MLRADKIHFRPKPIIDRDAQKERFQNKLSYGIENPVEEYRKKKKALKLPEPSDRSAINLIIKEKLALIPHDYKGHS